MDLSDPLVDQTLDDAMVARLATASARGRPHVNPLYFVRFDDRVWLGTSLSTLAARNVGDGSRVQLLLHVEAGVTPVVRMDGDAVVRTERSILRRYRRDVARKYMVTRRGLVNLLRHPRQWGPMRRHVGGAGACVIEVTPIAVDIAPLP